jgi:hypothetical protein
VPRPGRCAGSLGHRFDRAALAGAVARFEEDANLQALVHHPLLELDELDMQPLEFLLVLLPLELAVGFRLVILGIGHLILQSHPPSYSAVSQELPQMCLTCR